MLVPKSCSGRKNKGNACERNATDALQTNARISATIEAHWLCLELRLAIGHRQCPKVACTHRWAETPIILKGLSSILLFLIRRVRKFSGRLGRPERPCCINYLCRLLELALQTLQESNSRDISSAPLLDLPSFTNSSVTPVNQVNWNYWRCWSGQKTTIKLCKSWRDGVGKLEIAEHSNRSIVTNSPRGIASFGNWEPEAKIRWGHNTSKFRMCMSRTVHEYTHPEWGLITGHSGKSNVLIHE